MLEIENFQLYNIVEVYKYFITVLFTTILGLVKFMVSYIS
jgi:hypothetical protein